MAYSCHGFVSVFKEKIAFIHCMCENVGCVTSTTAALQRTRSVIATEPLCLHIKFCSNATCIFLYFYIPVKPNKYTDFFKSYL